MGWKDITAGDKTARAFKMRFIKSNTGTAGLEVAFRFKQLLAGGAQSDEQLTWVGWISDAARDRTMKTLVDVLGYNGSMDTNEDGVFTDPKVLDWDRDITLVIEMEAYEGKQYPKIKWVNKAGGSAFAGCAPEVVKNELNSSAFRAAFLAAQQSLKGGSKSSAPKTVNEEDLPF